MNENGKRSSARLDPKQRVALLKGLGDDAIQAAVLDESFAGLGLALPIRVDDCESLFRGKQLMIEYGDIRARAEIRHLSNLPSGCRLGVEWVAEGLSRSLRGLFVARSKWKDHSMSRILPSGLSKMWRLFEAGNWVRLMDTAEKLRRESVVDKLIGLNEIIDEFLATVELAMQNTQDETTISGSVEVALNEFILGLVDALELSADEPEIAAS